MPLIASEWEEDLYHQIAQETKKMKRQLIALNGMPDHIHLAIMLPATVTVAAVMKQVKGSASFFVSEQLLPKDSFFRWQEGYSAYAFHIDLSPKVANYIQNQKEHHATGQIWEALEATREDSTTARP